MKYLILFSIMVVLNLNLVAQDLENIVLNNAQSGTEYELNSIRSDKATVFIFFGNRCAYNNYYINRIKRMSEEFSKKGVNFILVNSNSSNIITEESAENMTDYLRKNNIVLPYLVDDKQVLKKSLGATRSPEAFLLTYRGGKVEIHYSGAIDDSPQSEGDASHHYLKAGIISLLENSSLAVDHVRPAGCLIR